MRIPCDWAWLIYCGVYRRHTVRRFDVISDTPPQEWMRDWHLDRVLEQLEAL